MTTAPDSISADLSAAACQEAERATGLFSLPFRRETWRGQTGHWSGSGIGSSIDFQDHRQYIPGDDPRCINWQAYARTGHYSMKLYREEVSPRVDLVLDASPSMAYDPAKQRRAMELFCFGALSTLQTNAQIAAYLLTRDEARLLTREDARTGRIAWPEATNIAPGPPALGRVPWRPQAMRVFVSDLLFPGEPRALCQQLAMGQAKVVILAPASATEADPPWLGNCELVECEGGQRFLRNFSETDLERYRKRYRNHFAGWQEACQRLAISFAQVRVEGAFADALLRDAVPVQAIELRNG